MNKTHKNTVAKNTKQYTAVSKLTKEHKKSKSLTPLLMSAMISMSLPGTAIATTYSDTLTGNTTDNGTYGNIKSNLDANTTLYSLSTGDSLNVVDDQSATNSNAEANAIKLDATASNHNIISGNNLTIGAEAKVNPNINGDNVIATANGLNIDSGTPLAQEIEFVGPITLSAKTSHESINYSALPSESIAIQLQLSSYGIKDMLGHTITFQDQAKIEAQAQGNNLTLFTDGNIDILTDLSVIGINYENGQNNNTLTFEKDVFINTVANGASQYLTSSNDLATQISSYNNLSVTGVYGSNLNFLGSQTQITVEALFGDVAINGAGSQIDGINISLNNYIQTLSGSFINFNGNTDIETRSITGHIDVSSAAEQIGYIGSNTYNHAQGVNVTNLNIYGDQNKIITEISSKDMTINAYNNEAGSQVGNINGYANNTAQGLSGSNVNFSGNANILTRATTGDIDISSAAEQTQSISSTLSTDTMGVGVNSLSIKGSQTKIITEALSGNITLSSSNSGENSVVNNINGSAFNYTQGLNGSNIAIDGNVDILTHTTMGLLEITSAAKQIGYIQSNQSTNTTGMNTSGLNLKGDQNKIITEVVSGNININTNNSEANSVVNSITGSMGNYIQGVSGTDIHITGNTDIETRLTAGSINIASAAEQIDSIQNNNYSNIIGISTWGDIEFQATQTKIITETVLGSLSINSSNSNATSIANGFYQMVNNNTQGISGNNLYFSGNLDIQTRTTIGGIDITSAAKQIRSIQNNLYTYVYGVNAANFYVKGNQTKIITETILGNITANTSNGAVGSSLDYINSNINSTIQGISAGNINFESNADILTRSTLGSLTIASAAEQIQGINSFIYNETYGATAWGSMNVNGNQANIVTNSSLGDISITANNSTQIDNISAVTQSFTSGLSGSGTDVRFQSNANIVATGKAGNIVIDALLAQGTLNNINTDLYVTGIQNTPATFEQSLNVIAQASVGNILINTPNLTMDTAPSLFAQAEGLLANMASQTTLVAGDTQILTSASSGIINLNGSISNGDAMAYAIHVQNNSLVDLQGNVSIQAIANAHQDSTIASGIEQAYALFAETDSAININQVGGKNVQLVGDLVADNSGLIYLNMDTANSYLRGLVNNQGGEINVALGNGATWQPTGNGDVTSNIRSALANSNISSTFGNDSPLDLQAGGIIDLAWWNNQNNQLNPNNRYRSLTIDNMVFNDGGEFRINTDIEHNQADKIIVTNAAGSGTQHIQVAYDPAMASMTGDHIILTATTLIPVLEVPVGTPINTVMGEIASIDSGLYRWTTTPEIIWDAATGVASIGQLDIHRTGNLSETPLTVSDAYTSLLNHWQLESSNMMRRVGDLRLSTENQNGVWARTYYGSLKSDSSYDRRFNQEFSGVQTGYDHQFDINAGKMSTGLMFNALQSDSSYSRGDGELTSYGVGVYTSWMSETGHYLDVVVRTSRLNNEYRLLDKNEQPAKGNYHTWAYGMSTEYGYRAQLDKQWFVEPQVELNLGFDLGRINNSAYSTSNGFRIDQAADNMVSSRVGLLLGTAFGEAIPSGNAYVRASWIYDFNRKGDVSVAYLDQSTKLDTLNRRGSAVEVNVGTNLKLAKQWHTYAELGKTWGNVVETDWQVNTGLRYNW